jgi:GNAT superfamily N-acetyltransferase
MDELRALSRPYSRAKTNCDLLPEEARRLIADGLLSYTAAEGALLLLERRDGYSKLYFRVADPRAALPRAEEPITVYLTYRGEPDGFSADWLAAQGFTRRHTQVRLAAERINAVSRHGVTPAGEDEALALFNTAFPNLTADLPRRGRFRTLRAVRGADGSPLGILHHDGAREPLLIAVRPEARGRGVASSLFADFVDASARLRGAYHIWAAEGNEPALRLYGKLGFAPEGLKSDLYIRTGES